MNAIEVSATAATWCHHGLGAFALQHVHQVVVGQGHVLHQDLAHDAHSRLVNGFIQGKPVKVIHDLPADGRPLSLRGDLQEMYRGRKPQYDRFKDWIIGNDRQPEDAANWILHIVEG